MPTAREVFEAHRALFGSVSHEDSGHACPSCLGPRWPHDQRCYACDRLLPWAPVGLHGRAVPMTAALSPGPWYTRLWTYKQGQPEYGAAVAALVHTYLAANEARIADLLGGPTGLLTIVPSKRPGVTFATQPFRGALARVPPLRERLAHTLVFVQGQQVQRWQYNPAAFAPGPIKVRGKRVGLLDDTWVTGATALSAAGALLRDGADAVVILSAARMVDAGFWPETHPYRLAMGAPYDPAAWPR